MMTLIHKAIRLLFITLDKMLAWAIGVLYELIVLIANVDIFGTYIFKFMDRVYAFLAVFMVFKLSISVVNYVLNPDQLVDKAKGFGKLIQRVIIVIILIISVPSIFEWAYDLQSVILNTNVLYTIVTGQKNDSSYDITSAADDNLKQLYIKMSAGSAGNLIKYNLMNSFIYSSNDSSAINSKKGECREIANVENYDQFKQKYNTELQEQYTYLMTKYNVKSTDLESFAKIIYEDVKYEEAYSCLVSLDTVNNTSKQVDGSFTNYYQLGISTLCVGFTVYIFLTICFDVALRTVRLGVLQLMAPIPIISMLDPASGKSGMFGKWVKDCTKTYTSLFIRLGGVYFAIEIIKAITTEGSFVWRGTNIGVDNLFVRVFVILGVLMFAKQLPQFIEGITGIKMDPGGLNLKKKVGGIPLAGKPMLAGAGLAGRTGKTLGKMGGRYLGKGVGALDNRLGGHGHNLVNATKRRLDAMSNRSKAFIKSHPGLQDMSNTLSGIGIDTMQTIGHDPVKKLEEKRNKVNDIQKQAAEIFSRAAGEKGKYKDLTIASGRRLDGTVGALTMADFQTKQEMLKMLEQKDTSLMSAVNREAHARKIAEMKNEIAGEEKAFDAAYIDAVNSNSSLTKFDGSVVSMGTEDAQTTAMISGLSNATSRSSVNEIKNLRITNAKSIKAAKDSMSNLSAEISRDINDKRELMRQQKEKK